MEIIGKGFTAEEFNTYLEKEVAPKMGAWRPRGVVLHNTWAPKLSQWPGIVNGKEISVEQRLANIKNGYDTKGWSGGPHLFIDRNKIWVFNPLWKRGTHSPSYNATHWGVELVGNFDTEEFPESMRVLAVRAIVEMYAMLGSKPYASNFHFHKEDPKTTHKDCPGKNVGTKEKWLGYFKDTLPWEGPGPHTSAPVVTTPSQPVATTAANKPVVPVVPPEPKPSLTVNTINDATLSLVKRWESFVDHIYSDRGFPAIGYGRRDGFRGFKTTPGMIITEAQASTWLKEDLGHLGTIVQNLIKVPLNDNQFGALVSFSYNVGTGALAGSTLLKKLNAGDYAGASEQFERWSKSRDPKTGELVMLEGLRKRRLSEKALFLS